MLAFSLELPVHTSRNGVLWGLRMIALCCENEMRECEGVDLIRRQWLDKWEKMSATSYLFCL